MDLGFKIVYEKALSRAKGGRGGANQNHQPNGLRAQCVRVGDANVGRLSLPLRELCFANFFVLFNINSDFFNKDISA